MTEIEQVYLMPQIEFAEGSFPEQFVSKKTGKPYYKQVGYLHGYERDGSKALYPSRVQVFVSVNKQTGSAEEYAPGLYWILPSSLVAGRFGDVEVGYLNLEKCTEKSGLDKLKN